MISSQNLPPSTGDRWKKLDGNKLTSATGGKQQVKPIPSTAQARTANEQLQAAIRKDFNNEKPILLQPDSRLAPNGLNPLGINNTVESRGETGAD